MDVSVTCTSTCTCTRGPSALGTGALPGSLVLLLVYRAASDPTRSIASLLYLRCTSCSTAQGTPCPGIEYLQSPSPLEMSRPPGALLLLPSQAVGHLQRQLAGGLYSALWRTAARTLTLHHKTGPPPSSNSISPFYPTRICIHLSILPSNA